MYHVSNAKNYSDLPTKISIVFSTFQITRKTSYLKMTASKFHMMMLPPELTEKIMYFAFFDGQESPDTETLDNCRKVCWAWSEIIKRNKEWGNITKSMIEKNWAQPGVPESFPSDKMIVHAKALGKSKDNLRTSYCNLKFIT